MTESAGRTNVSAIDTFAACVRAGSAGAGGAASATAGGSGAGISTAGAGSAVRAGGIGACA